MRCNISYFNTGYNTPRKTPSAGGEQSPSVRTFGKKIPSRAAKYLGIQRRAHRRRELAGPERLSQQQSFAHRRFEYGGIGVAAQKQNL